MWWYLIIRWRLRYLLLIISTTSWFRIWIGIEGILLVRAPAILCKWDRRNRERAIKYFIIQAISGGIILGGLIFRSYVWIGVGLVIKLGIWPAYYWIITVYRGIKWFGVWWVGGLIKLPGWIIVELCPLVIYLRLISILVGSIGGVYVSDLKKLFGWRSIRHTGWITLLASISLNWINYLIAYLLLTGRVFYMLQSLEVSNIRQISLLRGSEVAILTIPILSLAGLPPLAGFYLKWYALTTLWHRITTLIIPLLLVLGARIYYYLQIRVWSLMRLEVKPTLTTAFRWKVQTLTHILRLRWLMLLLYEL